MPNVFISIIAPRKKSSGLQLGPVLQSFLRLVLDPERFCHLLGKHCPSCQSHSPAGSDSIVPWV